MDSGSSRSAEPRAQPHHDIDNLVDVLRFRARTDTANFIFKGPDGEIEARWTAAELLRHASGVAQALSGLAPGSRVALVHAPGLDYAAAFYGAMLGGMVPVPVYPPDRASHERTLPRLEAIVSNAGVSALLTSRSTDPSFADLNDKSPLLASLPRVQTDALAPTDDDGRPGPAADALAFLQYTSGSTQTPRGVRISHRNLLHNSRIIEQLCGNYPGMAGATWLPPYHDMGLIGGIVQPVFAGFDIYMMSPLTFVRRPLRWLQAISDHHVRLTAAPNFAFELCVRRIAPAEIKGLDLSSWEVAICGAEPIQPHVMRAFADRFGPAGFRPQAFAPSYGLAEATLLVSARQLGSGGKTLRVDADALSRDTVQPCESGDREIVSCGPPAPEVQVRIVHPASGEDCGTAVGEIVVGGSSVAAGYHDSPAESARTFTPRGLRTGDLGFLHDGELYVVGRRKEMLIIRGRNYYPHDLEAAVSAAVPALRHSHVIAGTFDEDGDALPVILVEPATRKDDHARTVREIQAAIRQAFSIAIDAAVVPKGSVYRTSSGKLERRRTLTALRDGVFEAHAASLILEGALRARGSLAAEPASLAPPPADDVEPILQAMRELLASLLRVRAHDIEPEQPLAETGLDSLAAAELQSHVYEQYAVQLDLGMIARASLRELAQRIAETRAESAAARLSAGPPPQPSEHPTVQLALDALARPSLFFFRSTVSPQGPLYAALERAVRFADEAGFEAVWLPERHFHGFGAPFPNPAVLAAALAVQTTQISLRAGSVVMPLNHPLRVVEEWSMVDRLSGGRVALSFTSGWNPRDFVLSPADFEQRREKTSEGIETVRKLWRGESLPYVDGRGDTVSISSFPEPVQRELPVWLTCAERGDRFAEAGRAGFNVLTAPFFQDMSQLGEHIQSYRRAREAAGLDRGHVTVAVHAYVGETAASARAEARGPLRAYLASSARLWNPRAASGAALTPSEESELLDAAIERYMAGCLVGSEEECASRLRILTELGADEIACLTDFGVATDQAYAGLRRLAALWGL